MTGLVSADRYDDYHTCDNLSMTVLEIWFSFPGDCVLLPGDYLMASLTYHFEFFRLD